MFERSVYNAFHYLLLANTLKYFCVFSLCMCLLCLCFFAKTYIFLLICTELCLVTLCFFILISFPSVGGLVLSFMYILLAAGETALLMVMVFVFGDSRRALPFVKRTHYPGV